MAIFDDIKSYYVNILQREPSDDEVNGWAAPVNSGALTIDQVRKAFVDSPEAQHVAGVVRLYQAAFDRVPDQGGLMAWVQSGLSLEQIADGFASSEEFTNRYGTNPSREAFVTSLYYQVLGRAPDAGGLAAWTNSGQSFSEMLAGFGKSEEFQIKTTAAVTTFLDEAGKGTQDYSGKLIDYTPAPEPEVPGQTFTLTINPDNLTGTTSGDVFVANQVANQFVGVPVNTLDSSDLIDGGAGSDTLKATLGGFSGGGLGGGGPITNVDINSTSVETIEVRNVAGVLMNVNIADDVTTLIEANSTAVNDIAFTGAKAVSSVTSGGKADLTVSDMEAAAVSVNVAKAANKIDFTSVTANTTALTDLSVDFAGKLEVAAENAANNDTVTKLAIKANGMGVYSDVPADSKADSLTFTDSDKLTSVVVTGQGDLELNLGASQAKLTSFDAWGLAGGVTTTLSSTVLTSVEGGDGSDNLTTTLKDGGKVELYGGNDTLILTATGGYTVEGGAGDDKISSNVVAGKTTVINAGEGNDKVTVTGLVAAFADTASKLTVAMGAGDDFLDAGNLDNIAAGFNFDGGEGTDTIRITGSLGLAQASRISGFDVVDLSGNATGTIDMSRESAFQSIALDASATGVATTNSSVINAAAGTGISVSGNKAANTLSSVGTLSYSLADDTGTSDNVSVTLSAVDGGKDGLVNGQVNFTLNANKIETVNVVSTATVDVGDATASTPIEGLKASAYSNSFTLGGDSVKTVTVGGDAKVVLTIGDNQDKLETINATGNSAGVTVTLANQGVTFNGGSGDDVITSAKGGAVIHGGAGADSYNGLNQLVAAIPGLPDGNGGFLPGTPEVPDVKDTIVFSSFADSHLGLKANETTGVLELDFSQMDTITSFGNADKIDVSALGFTGARIDAFKAQTVANLTTLAENGGADFYKDGSVYKGGATFTVGGQSYLALDANKDGSFNAASDLVVKVTGVVGLDHTDFIFSA